MWEMPFWLLILLVVVISIAIYFLLRPLKVLNKTECIITHCFIIIGLLLISFWLWLNKGNQLQITMLIGGIWTMSGGICFAITYISRKLKSRERSSN